MYKFNKIRITTYNNSEILPIIFQLILLNNKDKLITHLEKHPEEVHEECGGLTTLCFAIKHLATDSVNILLDYGADPRSTENGWVTRNALINAVSCQNHQCTKILLDKGIKFPEEEHVLQLYVFPDDNVKLLSVIVEHYPTILTNEYYDGRGYENPLQLAVKLNATKCLKFLLKQNFPPAVLCDSLSGPLHQAIDNLNYKAYKLIINSPTITASIPQICQHHGILHRVCEQQADTTIGRKNKFKIIRHLLRHVPVDIRNACEYTALTFASDIRTARQLIEAGANANVKNIYGELPHEEADSEILESYLRLVEKEQQNNTD